MRNPKAHKLDDNIFDQHLFQQQRDLMERAYRALQALSYIFENHPAIQIEGFDDPLKGYNIWLW